jgi:uncharacterized damage-inducible protein DinB
VRVADLEQLYEYHYWANRRLFDAVARLTTEQFTQSVAGSYDSVRNTLVHVLSAEWGWLDRCGGLARGERLRNEDFPTLASLMEPWQRVEVHLRGFLSGLSDDDMRRDVVFSLGTGPKHSVPLGDLLHHGVIHGVHHRGQVALLVRLLGHVPGNFDLVVYAMEGNRTASA